MMYLSQRNLVSSNLSNFYLALEDAKAGGENITSLLEGSFGLERSQNMEVIDNPLKYYFMAYQASLIALLPQNGINQLLSSSFFIIFPFISGIYGVIIANAEIKYGTHKVHRTISSQWQIDRSKLLASAVSITSSLLISSVVFIVLQFLTPLISPVKVETFVNLDSIKQISYLSKAPYQIIFTLAISLFYFLIMFYLTLITKNILVGTFLLAAYNLFLPTLGKFDFKNIVLTFYPQIFNTNASTFAINTGNDLTLNIWIAIVPIALLMLYVLIMEKILSHKVTT